MMPDNSRAEKRLILYDVKKKEVKSRYPILDDARRIEIANHTPLARDSFDVLITYKHKNKTSQLWALKAPPNLNEFQSVPLEPSKKFTELAHFNGNLYHITTSADDGVRILDRESEELLCHIPTPVANKGLRGIACGSLHPGFITVAVAGPDELNVWSLEADSLKRQPESTEPRETLHLSEMPYTNTAEY